jgi:hypothetical protein
VLYLVGLTSRLPFFFDTDPWIQVQDKWGEALLVDVEQTFLGQIQPLDAHSFS